MYFPVVPGHYLVSCFMSCKAQALLRRLHTLGSGLLAGVLQTLGLLLVTWSCPIPLLEEKGFRWSLV